MKKYLPLLSILFVALFLSCDACDDPVGPNDNVPPMVDNPLWPYTENSFWEFDVWESGDGGDFNYFEKYRVVDVFGHDDNRVAQIEFTKYTEDTLFAEFTFWWGNTDSGLYEFAPFGEDFSPREPRLLFKFPAADMDSFQSYAYDFENPQTMFYFESGVPIIDVPAGSFENCVGYQLHYQIGHEPPIDNYYYFKPDTGYIRYERYEAGSLIKTRSLRDFALVPEPSPTE